MRRWNDPAWMLLPVVLFVLVCVIYGLLQPVVDGEPYNYMSAQLDLE